MLPIVIAAPPLALPSNFEIASLHSTSEKPFATISFGTLLVGSIISSVVLTSTIIGHQCNRYHTIGHRTTPCESTSATSTATILAVTVHERGSLEVLTGVLLQEQGMLEGKQVLKGYPHRCFLFRLSEPRPHAMD
ncbi:hypothetical protein L2E82_32934 [Cichorium intybus]|uniref:Uncharacterized protein n=1 Tax=Cichorium intybus TaxID=13427 RepID=A0ACB9BJ50_CICIN|nr:hypothetical protein L2E82_32934 [Cichorium intybus]